MFVLGQETALDPSFYERLGTAGLVAAILGLVIFWLLRDRTRILAALEAAQIEVKEANEKRLEQALALAPIASHLGDVAEALGEAAVEVTVALRSISGSGR